MAIISLIYLISNILSQYISMTGESLYSFDYLHLLIWTVKDWIEYPHLFLQSQACNECPGFGMYNRWTMFWFYLILTPGQFLKLNPLIWYFIVGFLLQFVGIHLLSRQLLVKLSRKVIFFVTLLYVTIPIRYEQFLNQWEYSFVHGFLLMYSSILLKIFHRRSIERIDIYIGICSLSGLIIFGIGHLPITIYLTIIFFIVSNLRHMSRSFLFFSGIKYAQISLSALLINIPIALSVLLNQSTIRTYSNYYVGMGIDEVLSLGFIRYREYIDAMNQIPYSILIPALGLLATLMILFGGFNRNKFIMFSLLLLIFGITSLGYPLPFFQKYLPFFETMRASYRFFIFVQITLLIAFLSALHNIQFSKNGSKKYIITMIFILIANLNLLFIIKNINLPNIIRLPSEYQKVYDEMHDSPHGRYVYFPITLNDYHGFNQDFSWTNQSPSVFFWWQNPFYSWLPSRNIHHPIPSMMNASLFSETKRLMSLNDQEGLLQLLKQAQINYIIIDKYYYWSREIPAFELDEFTEKKELKLMNDYGKIEIYSILYL